MRRAVADLLVGGITAGLPHALRRYARSIARPAPSSGKARAATLLQQLQTDLAARHGFEVVSFKIRIPIETRRIIAAKFAAEIRSSARGQDPLDYLKKIDSEIDLREDDPVLRPHLRLIRSVLTDQGRSVFEMGLAKPEAPSGG